MENVGSVQYLKIKTPLRPVQLRLSPVFSYPDLCCSQHQANHCSAAAAVKIGEDGCRGVRHAVRRIGPGLCVYPGQLFLVLTSIWPYRRQYQDQLAWIDTQIGSIRLGEEAGQGNAVTDPKQTNKTNSG